MKKVIQILVIALMLMLPNKAFAAGGISVSPSSLQIEVGSSKTFTISAYNTIGDVSISSSNSDVASVSTNEWGTGMVDEGQTKTGTITVIGKSVGTATITLTIDAATFDGDDLERQTRTITVNVVEKPTPVPTPTPEPTPTPTPAPVQEHNNNINNNNNNKNQNKNTNTKTNNEDKKQEQSNNQEIDNNDNEEKVKSDNNNIKEIKIDGFKLNKINDNNYSLEVDENTSSINISVLTEDEKASVIGGGIHQLKSGENKIEVVVKSESGKENKINLKVLRKFNTNDKNIKKSSSIDNNKLQNSKYIFIGISAILILSCVAVIYIIKKKGKKEEEF